MKYSKISVRQADHTYYRKISVIQSKIETESKDNEYGVYQQVFENITFWCFAIKSLLYLCQNRCFVLRTNFQFWHRNSLIAAWYRVATLELSCSLSGYTWSSRHTIPLDWRLVVSIRVADVPSLCTAIFNRVRYWKEQLCARESRPKNVLVLVVDYHRAILKYNQCIYTIAIYLLHFLLII